MGKRAADQSPAAVTGEDEGMEARVRHFGTHPEPEAATHRRSVVSGMEGNVRMRSLSHVLAVLVGDAHIVEADAVWTPGLLQPLVEADEIHRSLAHVAGDVPVVAALRCGALRPAGPPPPG